MECFPVSIINLQSNSNTRMSERRIPYELRQLDEGYPDQ